MGRGARQFDRKGESYAVAVGVGLAKCEDVRLRNFLELEAEPAAWKPLLEAACLGNDTLLFNRYDAYDAARNNAVQLKQYLNYRGGFSVG